VENKPHFQMRAIKPHQYLYETLSGIYFGFPIVLNWKEILARIYNLFFIGKVGNLTYCQIVLEFVRLLLK